MHINFTVDFTIPHNLSTAIFVSTIWLLAGFLIATILRTPANRIRQYELSGFTVLGRRVPFILGQFSFVTLLFGPFGAVALTCIKICERSPMERVRRFYYKTKRAAKRLKSTFWHTHKLDK